MSMWINNIRSSVRIRRTEGAEWRQIWTLDRAAREDSDPFRLHKPLMRIILVRNEGLRAAFVFFARPFSFVL